jgi:hypothetical protein
MTSFASEFISSHCVGSISSRRFFASAKNAPSVPTTMEMVLP